MAYARIDDGIIDHPKVLEAGEDARDLFIIGVIWCNKHLTDGRIPKAALGVLSQKKTAKRNAEALVRVGLWYDHGDHWQVHDYLDWNPSREEVEKQRAASAERMRKSRARRRGDRATNATVAAQPARNSAATDAHVAAQHTRNSAATNSASDGGVAAPTPLNLINPPIPPASGGATCGDPPEVRRVMASVLKRMAELSGATFSDSAELRARILEGHSEEDLIAVVESQWQREFMRNKREFFRPRTLFSARHFAEYLAIAKAQPAEDEEPAYGTAPRRYF